jgi:hypothetical protein
MIQDGTSKHCATPKKPGNKKARSIMELHKSLINKFSLPYTSLTKESLVEVRDVHL